MIVEKVALVTGASRGIGRAIAVKLAKQGSFVYINYIQNEKAALETLKAVEEIGGKGRLCPFDVRNEDAVQRNINSIAKEWGHIDILVNNAGVWVGGPLLRLGNSVWEKVIGTNLQGTINCCRAVIRHMIKRKSGKIINITSITGETGNAGDTLYSASKAGIIGFTKSLAREVGSRNICVNAVAPGLIETEMTATMLSETKEKIKEIIPLKRFGKPEDVANVVAFLASDDAEYITGQVFRVNGGLYM
ncbi:MAG: 3-oxoacyl-[acyl-carrier-protein] reductase [Syntrophales bacterium]|nr:3-oxoacyl-[acyl-carrier-protein] reductase [Syntrophales bacterium]